MTNIKQMNTKGIEIALGRFSRFDYKPV